jgi:hypothetical protein
MTVTTPARSLVTGEQRPRLFSCPAYATSAGADVIELAGKAGLFLDDWQRWFLTQAQGERDPDGKWAAFAVALICSRQNGKDVILEARQLAGLFAFGETLIIHTAHEFRTAQEAFLRILQLIEGYPDLDQEVAKAPASHGEEGIILKPTPTVITGAGGHQITRSRTARLRFLARHKGAGRGFTGDLVIYNEAMYLDSGPVAASLPTMATRMSQTDGGPQVWYTGSAGVGAASQQLARVRERGIAGGTSLCFAEWSIELCDEACPPRCGAHDDPGTEQAAAKANPGYNLPGRYDPEMVQRFRDEMDEPTFLREILGVGTYPVPAEGWAVIPKTWWASTMAGDDQRAARPVFAIDTTPDRAYTSVAACGTPGGTDKPRIELCDHRAGQRWAAAYAASLDERRGPGVWIVDKGAAAGTLIGALEDAGLRVECPTATDVAHACGRLYDALRDREIDHACDREVQTGLAGLAQRRLGAGFAWDQRAAVVDISGVYAYTFAFWGWEKFGGQPADYDTGESVGFGPAQIISLFTSGTYGAEQMRRMRGRGLITDDMLAGLAAAGVHVPAGI